MTKYNATATVEWGRLAGLADDPADDQPDDQVDDAAPMPGSSAAPMPGSSAAPAAADVAILPAASAVSWSVTIDGVPIDISIRAHGPDKARNTSIAATVARQVQLAARVRAATHKDQAVRMVLRALVPAQAQAAVKAASTVVGLLRSGRLRGMLRHLRGGARVIGRALVDSK